MLLKGHNIQCPGIPKGEGGGGGKQARAPKINENMPFLYILKM